MYQTPNDCSDFFSFSSIAGEKNHICGHVQMYVLCMNMVISRDACYGLFSANNPYLLSSLLGVNGGAALPVDTRLVCLLRKLQSIHSPLPAMQTGQLLLTGWATLQILCGATMNRYFNIS